MRWHASRITERVILVDDGDTIVRAVRIVKPFTVDSVRQFRPAEITETLREPSGQYSVAVAGPVLNANGTPSRMTGRVCWVAEIGDIDTVEDLPDMLRTVYSEDQPFPSDLVPHLVGPHSLRRWVA